MSLWNFDSCFCIGYEKLIYFVRPAFSKKLDFTFSGFCGVFVTFLPENIHLLNLMSVKKKKLMAFGLRPTHVPPL